MPTFSLNKIKKTCGVLACAVCVVLASPSFAQQFNDEMKASVPATQEKPPVKAKAEYTVSDGSETRELSLQSFQALKRNPTAKDEAALFNSVNNEDAALAIRRDSQKESALSYGARGGLQWRTIHIMKKLDKQAYALDRSFNFRRLLIKAPTNLLIEPPIIREAIDALLVDNSGQEAAVADAIYNISQNAKIVTSARTWRDYLYRDSGEEIALPPTVLLPETIEEEELWQHWVKVGWYQGIKQADAIFESDVQNMVADFQGMVRYRILLAEGKVSPPYAVLEDRGITGGGSEMRVGDRAIRITGPSQLKASTGGQTWTPGIR